ncbi:MAG: hypothetical protein BWX89_01613 [candidate division TA06 bacterium ADurb.Bin131]|jgi:secondary thiamine-phosphate synthase enzyme|uniref:YjbQ family protein n=1 Tax=candidate division TA06 bacterium ADurb.Bin131 TaxID=1852827 RepID=A0A1V6C443_UNCT6|nr:MAG: hypothetical protein BWX89_01613 [candidate division TA06 bacterium ADurb.Bin131]HOC02066.1 secondary thiamine-phosphate synthase enzyme YjbQ [bacterium]HQL64902.1 secondary thiamine-phosphate synthase enzyme YjbQ [bacterium]
MKKIIVRTTKRKEMVDITDDVQQIISNLSIKNGICVLFIPHTTCGITINENADISVRRDILSHFSRMVPEDGLYQHLEGNSDAHIQSTMSGHSLILIVENQRIQLGTWQGIFLCEFDGPRTREVWISTLSSSEVNNL